ncbi:MAG: nucleotide exchange factor GrpE [Alteraurantiacibacter sp.]
MSDIENSRDDAVENELEGVPEEFLSDDEDGEEEGQDFEAELAQLRDDLEAAKQETLYAKAEAQNQRRRLEKEVQDARAYAATGFARDILSVADNLARGIDAIPEDLREDSKFKGLVAGIQATQRELDKVFTQHGITRIAAMGLPLDPNQHQAMMEVPTDDAEPGTVVQEMQAGYMIKDRLLRASMVGVAKKP